MFEVNNLKKAEVAIGQIVPVILVLVILVLGSYFIADKYGLISKNIDSSEKKIPPIACYSSNNPSAQGSGAIDTNNDGVYDGEIVAKDGKTINCGEYEPAIKVA